MFVYSELLKTDILGDLYLLKDSVSFSEISFFPFNPLIVGFKILQFNRGKAQNMIVWFGNRFSQPWFYQRHFFK